MAICFLISEHSSGQDMPVENDNAMRFLIPRCFRRNKTFDLLAARDPMKSSRNTKQEPHSHFLSWDSAADTYLSPPSSVGAEAGGVVGTTHIGNLDSDIFTAQLKRQEISKEATFRLHQLAHLDMRNSSPSFVYQVPQQSDRKWSMATTQGSTGGQLQSTPKACPT